MLAPAAGTVVLDGRDLHDLTRRQTAQHLAVLPQEAATDFHPTVIDVVMLGRTPHQSGLRGPTGEDSAIVGEALANVGIVHLAERAYPTLSGGERQRAQLARTVAQQTPVLLLDEPSNHLDVAHQYGLFHTVRSLRATTIAALHDINLAAACCDELAVLAGGRVVAAGPPHDVLIPELISQVWDVPCEAATAGRPPRPHVVFHPDHS